jgi:amidase
MYAVPDVDEVVAVAKQLGVHLTSDEAALYHRHVVADLGALDAFVQSRVEEQRPPLVSPVRARGCRPSREEDPLNAWVWKCRIEGAQDGLLAGKTVSFKDHIPVAGIPMSLGTFALEGFIPDFDATVVTRVLEAGGTIVGKNTMDGLSGGFGFGGGIGDYGRPVNPHDPEHVTGGSSSGSAVAVATGQVDIAFGGDQGGSIRIPAALSGSVGLKPTFGLVSHFGISWGADPSLDYTGPMGRRVEDVAAGLQATAGYDDYDPRQRRDVPITVDAMTGLDRGVSDLRIGVLEEGFDDADSDVRNLVMSAIDVLAGAGAEVSEISIPEHHRAREAQLALMPEGTRALFETGFLGAYARTYYPEGLVAAVNKLWAHQADVLRPGSKLGYITAEFSRRNFYGRAYAKAHNVRPLVIRAFDAALAELDTLVMPTCIITAPKYEAPATHLDAVEQNLTLGGARMAIRNTMPYNFTGHPALAVPVGKTRGLPVSMQLVGRFFDDPLLLRVAYAYQQSVDWDEVIAVRR